jgi:hypothetical protein
MIYVAMQAAKTVRERVSTATAARGTAGDGT